MSTFSRDNEILFSGTRHDIRKQFEENTSFDMSADTDFKETGSELDWRNWEEAIVPFGIGVGRAHYLVCNGWREIAVMLKDGRYQKIRPDDRF